jgi:2-haloacid dehalogenase
MGPRVIAFDVNETLLDLRSLDPVVEELLGDASLRAAWFAQMLQVAFVGAITDRYVDFTTAQCAALAMLAQRRGATLPAGAADRVAAAMRTLPPHGDAAGALERLRAGGLELAALSNSPQEVERAQLAHAGLADTSKRSSPPTTSGPSSRAGSRTSSLRGRSGSRRPTCGSWPAHAWDLAGALAAGCRAAFVARPGMPLSPIGPQPDIVAADLADLADRILAG